MAKGGTQAGHAGPEERVRLIVERAGAHAQRGELAAARNLYEEVLGIDPVHPEALNFIAVIALQSGDAHHGIELLERGVAAHPSDANLLKNLGLACRAGGMPADALKAFAAAIALKPNFTVALLNEGALLTELGRSDEALASYLRAFHTAEHNGLFLNLSSIPPGVRVLADKALVTLQQARRAVFQEALAPMQGRYGHAALDRVWHCLESYLGLRPPIELPTLQRPTFLSFPGLPARAWFEREEFPWVAGMESQAAAIHEELLAVLAGEQGFQPFVEMSAGHPGATYWQALNHSPDWNAFFLHLDGQPFVENQARCPQTRAALDAVPLNRIADHSPETLYSVLKPGAHIPPHTGVINVRLVVHLPLIVPPDCGIRVGTETRGWQEGRCLVFDDTYEHEAWNKSDHTRVVLIFDVWNPGLTAAERDGMQAAIEALGRFNRKYGAVPPPSH